jgi:peptide/nickel transport system permease protein
MELEIKKTQKLKLPPLNAEIVLGSIISGFFVILAIVVEVCDLLKIKITPYNPIQQNVGAPLSPPSFSHIFGTDPLGRDVLSRIIAATPSDIAVGFAVVALALAIGTIIGTSAALKGGVLDEALMRITDIVFALPALVIAIAIAAAIGPGIFHMMLALMAVWWPPYARLARGESLKVSHQNFIEASYMAGAKTWKVIFKHIVPNIFPTLLVYSTLDIGTVILAYAGLGYLGLSVKPPTPDWGEMVSSYQGYLLAAPWLPVIPGLIVTLNAIGFSLLGDGLRDALEL